MSLRTAKKMIACGLAALLCGCAADIAKSPPGAKAPAPYVYRLAAADQLRINVYNEPGLSAEYTVNSEGDISFPLVGMFHAAGMTVNEAAISLTQALQEHFFKNPHLVMDLVASRPIYVLGEVNKAGQFPYQADMTVLDAVATAGGFTYRANQKTVMIRHPGEAAERREALTADMLVQPGDSVRIRERNF